MRRIIVVPALIGTAVGLLLGQGASKKSPPAKTGEQKYKAIWEPVNVPEDLQLKSVHFVSPDEGWVAGGKTGMTGGVILYTSDGGANWQVQLGDTQSSDRPYTDLRVLGPKLAWAAQSTSTGDHKLLRTTDGQSWAPAGTVGQHRTDYQFVSQDVGFYTEGDTIFRTQDGGRTWRPVYRCAVKADVGGLTRELRCQFSKMDFVNANLGYAISASPAREAGFVIAKTADGGSTWTPWMILPGEEGKEGALHFFDENNGVVRTIDGKLFRTTDGGKTWSGVAGQAEGKPDIEFADNDVGWMVVYHAMTYTTNAGRQWVSREIRFPAQVTAFCLVRRDRGYAVGEHGMVYRYRVVPVEYAAKGMLAAPMMPAK